jgi:micrococcal nuclease
MKRTRKKTRQMNNIAVVFFMLIALFYLLNEKYSIVGQKADDKLVTVMTVNDGDTVTVFKNKKREKIRLIGIDAPEMGQKPWGEKARKYLESILSSSDWKVTMELDVEERDKYGRMLAYLRTTDGSLVNVSMVKNGYALLFTFPPNVKYVTDLRAAQREARERKAGIWGENGLDEKPGDYRKEHPRF